MEQNENDIIKTFLKIEKTEDDINDLFSLDKNNKIFSLISLDGKKTDFELNKIFINDDENSYIYEMICQNCIEDYIKGINYCFISYGETVNNKFEFLIGNVMANYININNYGIFLRFLNELLTKKNKKEFDYLIKISNFLIYEDGLLDLTYFGGKNKKDYEIDINLFLSNAHKITKDSNIINKMKKINLFKFNDILQYIHYIHIFLSKLKKEKIYNKSNICFIIYLLKENTKEIVSATSFIILLGSENLYKNSKDKKIINENNINNNQLIQTAKISIEASNIFNSIINSISYISQKNKNDIKYEPNESKLTTVLNDICFGKNIENIKYRIIGNIKPMKGYYQNTKDVLIFLFDCWKILNSNTKKDINIKNDKENNQLNLEYIIKEQKNKINNMNWKIEKLNRKIEFLRNNYQKQINTIKNCFEFDGDINKLLLGDENSKEMKLVRDYKNYKNIVNNCKYNQKILENNLEEATKEIEILKEKLDSKKVQQDMISYYLSAQKSNKLKNDNKDKNKFNDLSKQIEELKQKLNNKDKLISIMKKELEEKTNIILTLSNTISIIKNEKEKEKERNKIEEEKKENSFLKKELENMKLKKEKTLEEIKNNYDMMVIEKNEELYNLKQNLESNISNNNKTMSELIKLYKLFINFISYIESNKSNLDKNNDDLTQSIFDIKNKINNMNYPNLFKKLNENSENNNNEKNLENKEDNNSNQGIKIKKDNIILDELKEKYKSICLSFDLQVNKNNNNIIIINSQKRTIEKLEREILLYKQILKKKKSSNNNNALLLSKNFEENKIMKKSFSFNNKNIIKAGKPLIIKRNKNNNDIYNYDSFRQVTTNNSNILTSFQNTKDENIYNKKNIKEFLLMQKRIKNDYRNKRPLSASREAKNNFIFSTN